MTTRRSVPASPDDILYEILHDERGWFVAPPVPIIAWEIDEEDCVRPITTDAEPTHFVFRRGGSFWTNSAEFCSGISTYVEKLNHQARN